MSKNEHPVLSAEELRKFIDDWWCMHPSAIASHDTLEKFAEALLAFRPSSPVATVSEEAGELATPEELNGKYEEGERERRQRLFEVEASGNGGCMDWNQLRQDIAWLIRKERDWQMLYHRQVLINHSFTEGSERA